MVKGYTYIGVFNINKYFIGSKENYGNYCDDIY